MLTSINMSFQDLNEFLFDADREQIQNKFIATSSNLYSLYDSNNYSYNNGTITYNSTTLQASSTSNRTLEMKNAYLSIPFGCTVTLAGTDGSFTMVDGARTAGVYDAAQTFNPRCANLITVKNFQHAILHSVRLVLGGKVLLTGSELHSLFTQEKMKRFNQDKQDLFGDLTCSHFDDDKAMRIVPGGALEINNDPLNNEAIRKRSKLNTNYVSKTNFEALYPSNIPNDCFEGGLIAAYDDLGSKIMDPANVTRRIRTLVFQYIAYIPLAFISPFFENMPSCRTLQSMELRITTNLSNNNSWKVGYSGTTVNNTVSKIGERNTTYKIFNPTSTVSNQSVGSLCPFMITQLAETADNDFGLPSVSRPNASTSTIELTVTPYIGFYASSDLGDNVVANGKITARPTNYPCAIHIPTVAYKANLLQEINNQPAQTILYDDFIVDTSIQQRAGGSTVMHNLTFTAGRLRKLYIIPYLHASANFCSVNQSLISSAPVTVSPCKLGNFMVSSASVNLFPQPLYHSHEFFTQMNMIGLAEANGNAFISPHVTGQITYDLFKRGAYNVYEVLLDRAYDEVADNQSPSLQVNFKILNNANCVYNFVLLTVFQSAAVLDRIDGSIMSSSDV